MMLDTSHNLCYNESTLKKEMCIMKTKEVKCKNCGKEISSKAVVCPECGVKIKKPLYKRAWFIIAVIIVVVAMLSTGKDSTTNTNNSNTSENQTVQTNAEYTEYTVAELIKDLGENPLKAEEKYNGQYVKISGKLLVIDSDGKYITLEAGDGSFSMTGVQCYLKNDEQKQKIIEMNIGDEVVLKGKIKDIGEIIGYQLDIDSIE